MSSTRPALGHPKYWPTHLLVGLLWLLSRLSMPAKLKFGDWLGRVGYRRVGSVARVTDTNLAMCLPELDDDARRQLAEDCFAMVAQGAFEGLHAWWCDLDPYIDQLHVEGRDVLEAAQRQGRGVLILGGHFSILDFALPLVAAVMPNIGYMYRPNNNPVIDRMIQRGRERNPGAIPFHKRQLREMIDRLRAGGEVWYACDQDLRGQEIVFAPFFGVPASCITTPSWIARESGAAVVFMSQFRRDDDSYELRFTAMPENFGDDPLADAQQWNAVLETEIRRRPSQYLWLHKRFKTRPPGEPPVYDD